MGLIASLSTYRDMTGYLKVGEDWVQLPATEDERGGFVISPAQVEAAADDLVLCVVYGATEFQRELEVRWVLSKSQLPYASGINGATYYPEKFHKW